MLETKRNFAADRAIIEAATEGPWTADGCYVEIPDDSYVGGRGPLAYGGVEGGPENATFIAAARTGWPAALDRIAELEAELSEVSAELATEISDYDRLQGILVDIVDKLQILAKKVNANGSEKVESTT
ncbi:hypothetical protein ACFOQM_23640 [Paenibacillus sp. GCM10012307]|uniref:Uncharacterized protein n=1 Tax=Paenibacillus roseus TaxID=2798579 RepID=A0A934J3S8_9BACL|nr:hypothetical protein [Paenibacillus roseus]MBJ6364217.1 hypothetical protein [Paenibacillus roseus]